MRTTSETEASQQIFARLDELTSVQLRVEERQKATEAAVQAVTEQVEQMRVLLASYLMGGPVAKETSGRSGDACRSASKLAAAAPAAGDGAAPQPNAEGGLPMGQSLSEFTTVSTAVLPLTLSNAKSSIEFAALPLPGLEDRGGRPPLRRRTSTKRALPLGTEAGGGSPGSSPGQHTSGTSFIKALSTARSCVRLHESARLFTLRPAILETENPLLLEDEVEAHLCNLQQEVGAVSSLRSEQDVPTGKYMLEPYSRIRVVHDICSFFVLLYDVITTPIAMAWDFPIEGDTRVLMACVVAFWTWDIILSFHTGFFEHGELVMKRRIVVRRYLKSWFLPDAIIVSTDFFVLTLAGVFAGSKYTGGILRVTKFSRFVRLARLCRVARTFDTVERTLQRYAGSGWDIAVEILKPFLSILLINHLLACCWFAISQYFPSDTGRHWIDDTLHEDTSLTYRDADFAYQYFTCLHWGLTQLTPGSMQVFPSNTIERIFNALCLALGMLVFGCLISSLSARMMSYRASQKDRMTKLAKLRRFLHDKGVCPALAVTVLQQATQRMSNAVSTPLVPKNVAALSLLSASLRRWLQAELCRPCLVHPIFHWWTQFDGVGMQVFCHEATEFISVASGDPVFFARSAASCAYVVVKGRLQYAIDEELTAVSSETGLISEAALWCEWKHVGELTAMTGCEVLVVSAGGVEKSLDSSIAVRHVIGFYARAFCALLFGLSAASTAGARPEPEIVSMVECSDLPAPEMNLSSILPTLPLSCRLLIAAAAVKVTPQSSWKFMPKRSTHELLEEVRLGKCSIMLNSQWQPVRVVALVVLRLERADGRVLAHIGEERPDGSIHADCKLPGYKHGEGETLASVLQKVLLGILAPIRESVQVYDTSMEESEAVSERINVATRYIRTVVHAKLPLSAMDSGLEDNYVARFTKERVSIRNNQETLKGTAAMVAATSASAAARRGSQTSASVSLGKHGIDFDMFALAERGTGTLLLPASTASTVGAPGATGSGMAATPSREQKNGAVNQSGGEPVHQSSTAANTQSRGITPDKVHFFAWLEPEAFDHLRSVHGRQLLQHWLDGVVVPPETAEAALEVARSPSPNPGELNVSCETEAISACL